MVAGLNSGALLLVYRDFQALSWVVTGGRGSWGRGGEVNSLLWQKLLALCMCKGACPGTVSLQSAEQQRFVCVLRPAMAADIET
jgi:hypothetical protein